MNNRIGNMKKDTDMTNESKLRQTFQNLSDCYADTGKFENDGSYTEGDVIQAMTEDRFIEVLNKIINYSEDDMGKAWSAGYHNKVDEINGRNLIKFDAWLANYIKKLELNKNKTI